MTDGNLVIGITTNRYTQRYTFVGSSYIIEDKRPSASFWLLTVYRHKVRISSACYSNAMMLANLSIL
jgi:hypothetical protein